MDPIRQLFIFGDPRVFQTIDPKVPELQDVILCFVIDIGTILTKSPFMFFDRCWSHLQYFRDVLRRISRIFQYASFPTCSVLEIMRFPKISFQKTCMVFSWIVSSNLVGPKSRIMVSGGH